MIPKIIHYIWIGPNPLPEIFYKCYQSWKVFCPDFEIILWTENNINYREIPFLAHTYETSQFAKFSDYYRMYIVYKYGGVYMDIDVELLKPLGNLLDYKMFFSLDTRGSVNSGSSFGAIKNQRILLLIMEQWINYYLEGLIPTCPEVETEVFKNQNLFTRLNQDKISLVLLPHEYFNPIDWQYKNGEITPNTIGLHHYAGSWLEQETLHRLDFYRKTASILGIKNTKLIELIISYSKVTFSDFRDKGFILTVKKILKKISSLISIVLLLNLVN